MQVLRQFRAEALAQPRKCTAPGLMYGGVATGQRHVAQVGAPLETLSFRNQKLPSPHLAVSAVAGAIECHANHLPVQAVLCHATDDVRMMMLHSDPRQPGFCS